MPHNHRPAVGPHETAPAVVHDPDAAHRAPDPVDVRIGSVLTRLAPRARHLTRENAPLADVLAG